MHQKKTKQLPKYLWSRLCLCQRQHCMNRRSLFLSQAWTHHGAVELSHFSGKHLGLSDCRLLGLLQLGHVLHRTRAHHHHHGRGLLSLSH